MKKVWLASIVVALLFSPPTYAHVLITDQTSQKGGVLHIIPDDDPVAGEEAMLYFDIQSRAASSSQVALHIQGGGVDESLPMTSDGKLATARYTFPTQGVYDLRFTVKEDGSEYQFNHSQRVSRGVVGNADSRPRYAWAEIVLLGSGTLLIVLSGVAFNRRGSIKKNSKL